MQARKSALDIDQRGQEAIDRFREDCANYLDAGSWGEVWRHAVPASYPEGRDVGERVEAIIDCVEGGTPGAGLRT